MYTTFKNARDGTLSCIAQAENIISWDVKEINDYIQKLSVIGG